MVQKSIAEFVFENGKGIYTNSEDVESTNQYLTSIEQRYPSENQFLVYLEEEIHGWIALGRKGDSLVEAGRWLPVLRRSNEQDKVASILIQGMFQLQKRMG